MAVGLSRSKLTRDYYSSAQGGESRFIFAIDFYDSSAIHIPLFKKDIASPQILLQVISLKKL
jgi:hypothetical protein